MTMDNEESFTAVPMAIVDTNVCLEIYSWYDFLEAAQKVFERDPTATLEHPEIQLRAQRARYAFGVSLLFNERSWATLVAYNEVGRTIVDRVPPDAVEHGARSNFVRLYAHFIKDNLLPSWHAGGDLAADAEKTGNDVDRLCLELAEQHKIPLISWEGSGRKRAKSKLIPKEAARRGIDLVTPKAFVQRERFSGTDAARRFFASWDELAPRYLAENPGARETMEVARHFYWRLAANS